ncbi:MAG: hypothetical protein HQ497_02130 [SAR86 cluster bacterium]|uniref:Uncharacterized protein n=1 Tax=SAR86 cluster bacterium TaxID=2030880 RepID=A0A973A7X1_9GAMM|nr:hypothetical protein [SAR86 cluster bacterium]
MQYFTDEFDKDLTSLFECIGSANKSISLITFTRPRHPVHIARWAQHFARLPHKKDFLYCLFFTVLFDQTLHSLGFLANLERDGVLENPKLKGLLASANSHMSPFNLLLASTLWLQESQEEAEFRKYCSFFSSEFERFCEEYLIPSRDMFESMGRGVPDADQMLRSVFFRMNYVPNTLVYSRLLTEFNGQFR